MNNTTDDNNPLPVMPVQGETKPDMLEYAQAPVKKPKVPLSIFARALLLLPAFYTARNAGMHHTMAAQAIDDNQYIVSRIDTELKEAHTDRIDAEKASTQPGARAKAEHDYYTSAAQSNETDAQGRIHSAQNFANIAVREAKVAQGEGQEAAALALAGGIGFNALKRRKAKEEADKASPAATR